MHTVLWSNAIIPLSAESDSAHNSKLQGSKVPEFKNKSSYSISAHWACSLLTLLINVTVKGLVD